MTVPIALAANDELLELIQKHTAKEGENKAKWVGLTFYRFKDWVPAHWDQTSSLAFCIVVQGCKRVNINGHEYFYGPSNYFVMSRGMRFQAEVLEGSPTKPFLSMVLQIPAAVVAEVLIETRQRFDHKRLDHDVVRSAPNAYVSSEFGGELRGTLVRFLRALDEDGDRKVLGPLILREFVYRLLKQDQAQHLMAAVIYEKSWKKVMAAIRYMQTEFHRPITIDEIANAVGASTSALAHSFKNIIGASPYHFLKQLRLERARVLMIREGWNSNEAARRTGYESLSHFTKAFKDYFGECPSGYANQFRRRPTFNLMETMEVYIGNGRDQEGQNGCQSGWHGESGGYGCRANLF